MLSSLIALLTSAGAYKKLFNGTSYKSSDLSYITFNSQGENLQMAYLYKTPAKPNGKTILLLHGKNFSASYWKPTVNFLLNKGYAVLAPEQVGFGRSDQPLNYQFSFQQLALNTKLLLDSLRIKKVTLLGHSMGGMLAARFSLMFPENCERLILENPIGLEDWKLTIPYSAIDEENRKERSKTGTDLKDYMTKNYFHGEWKEQYEQLLKEQEELFLNSNQFPAYAKNMALTSDMIFTQPVCYEFKNITCPVVLIIGQEDKTAPGKERAGKAANKLGDYRVLGKKTAAEIPNCRLIKLEGIGHIPHVENFNLFTDSLNRVL